MFKTKRKLLNEQAKVKNRDILIEDLIKQKEQLKKENTDLRHELEEERFENSTQHRTLFNIKQALNKPYGTYESLLIFRNDIKKELSYHNPNVR